MYKSLKILSIVMVIGAELAQARDFKFSPREGMPLALTKEVFEKKVIDVDEKSPLFGWTPLIVAASNGDWHLVQYLIDSGANVNLADDSGGTPLFAASWHKHPVVVEKLLKAGANPNADADGLTPLMAAAWRLNRRTIALLLDAGADPSMKDPRGWTALDFLEDRKKIVDKDYQDIKKRL